MIQTVCALVPGAEVRVAVLFGVTVMGALAIRSATGTLSTWVFTDALPPVPFVVKVAVAVPLAWMVNC